MSTKLDAGLRRLEAKRTPTLAYPPGPAFWDPSNGAWNANGDVLCTFGLGGMRLCYDLAIAGDVAAFEQLLSIAAAENDHRLDGPRLAWAIEASKRAALTTQNDPWWNAAQTVNDALELRDWLKVQRETKT